jgi:5-methylcytosine-specific restriction endonuclease McrBC regulatory subunit McrC
MNRLFEGFLLAFLDRHRGDILPPTLAGCELLPQTSGAVQALATREGGEPVFRLKPDLAFRSAGLFRALADAKYKRLDPTADDAGVGRGDFYLAAVYAQRYAAPRVLLLYPQLTTTPVRARFRVGERHGRTDHQHFVLVVDVHLRIAELLGGQSVSHLPHALCVSTARLFFFVEVKSAGRPG